MLAGMHGESRDGPAIEFCDVSYELPSGRRLLSDLNLQVQRGETLVFLGRSGSGKTTTLKMINRLLTPTQGEVCVDGATAAQTDVIRLRRGIGYVIQEIGLLPHFTVERNIGLVPEIEAWPSDKIRARTQELMQIVGLDPQLAARYPHQLSGGQRQRVGVARALAADPAILLMDEPFGALDPLTREELQREFLSLQQRLQKTVVFVTHDLNEALRLGTRIALMEGGKLVTVLPPRDFLQSHDSLAAAYVRAFGSVLDPAVVEAARGMGLTDQQLLLQVQLPLAMSVILSGVRVAVVISVGMATIAAAIGAGGLGELIFRGLAMVNNQLILAGAIPAALLALLADFLLGRIEAMLRPAHLRS